MRGRSHTFDSRADGFGRGEACGAALLDAGDGAAGGAHGSGSARLQGAAVRQDGKSASLTAPNGQAQQALLQAAASDARQTTQRVALETHGTGTTLGDPIETGAFVSHGEESASGLHSVGATKANMGHTEPAAGMVGLLKLFHELGHAQAAPNAQLRQMNPHVKQRVVGAECVLPTQLSSSSSSSCSRAGAGAATMTGGVSSFGLGGTIAHLVLVCGAKAAGMGGKALPALLAYQRRAFPWHERRHSFVQRRAAAVITAAASSDRTVRFHSPAVGALHALVADHVVQGRVIFPGVGYLEMARAAVGKRKALQGVYFLQPLAVEAPGLLVEAAVFEDGRFEVRSGSEAGAMEDATMHCSGGTSDSNVWQPVDCSSLKISLRAANVGTLYDSFDAVGLQYGPGYRTLAQAWGGANKSAARLRKRVKIMGGAHVHPADLDGSLHASAVMDAVVGGGGETRLPFAVDDALLQNSASVELWAVRRLPPACTRSKNDG
jgi:acyl transferase domain-containing protein